MRKILVPFDGSQSARNALHYAANMARDNADIRLDVLCVIEPMSHREHLTMSDDANRQLEQKEASAMLQPAIDILDREGVPYESHSRIGSPANEIALHCSNAGCEAIVMGTRGLGPLAALAIGSTATRVVHLVDVPVTLIK
jgi:nucleotide-binding universal stress UspA family protein